MMINRDIIIISAGRSLLLDIGLHASQNHLRVKPTHVLATFISQKERYLKRITHQCCNLRNEPFAVVYVVWSTIMSNLHAKHMACLKLYLLKCVAIAYLFKRWTVFVCVGYILDRLISHRKFDIFDRSSSLRTSLQLKGPLLDTGLPKLQHVDWSCASHH